jgi:hypothetical protein
MRYDLKTFLKTERVYQKKKESKLYYYKSGLKGKKGRNVILVKKTVNM